MITLPVSNYPAASDESSQIQVLSEKKGEIAQKIEDVGQSGLSKNEKSRITENLKAQSDDITVRIRRKNTEKDYKNKLLNKRVSDKKAEEKRLSDNDEKRCLDIRA